MKWTTLSAVIRSVVRLMQVAILTRFLPKEDFGTIAIATLFIGFTELFLDMGLSSAIIHRQDITRQHYSSLFWFNVFTGLLLTAFLWICSPLVSSYYHDDSLTRIIRLLSLNVLFSSIGRQHLTLQQKKLNFKLMSLIDLLNSVLTMILAVVLAYTGFGVYSLVYSTIFSIAFPSLIYFTYGIIHDRNITFHFRLSDTYSYLKIGVYQIGSSFLDYCARELDVFIISVTLGKDVLGVYSLCKKIVQMMYGIINPILTKVLTPLFALLQSARAELKSKYLKLVELLSVINYPLYFMVALSATAILKLLYGETYIEGHWILSFLAVNYGILSIANPVGSLQVALGRTDIGLIWTVYRIISNGIFIYCGSLISFNAMALFILINNIVNIYPFWYIQLRPLLGLSFREYLKPQYPSFGICLILTAVLSVFFSKNANIALAILLSVVFAGVYLYVLSRLFPSNYLNSLLKEYLGKYKLKFRYNLK